MIVYFLKERVKRYMYLHIRLSMYCSNEIYVEADVKQKL